jgi:hypothetical protein
MAEFMLALFPVMMVFLGVTQFCFISAAKLLVRHSAVVAARAAVVVIEESQDLPAIEQGIYGGAKAGILEDSQPAQTSPAMGASGPAPDPSAPGSAERDRLASVADSVSSGTSILDQLQTLIGGRDATRLAQIRTAAYIPMLAISPDVIQTVGFLIDQGIDVFSENQTVARAIGTSGVSRLVGSFLYNVGMLAVTFPEEPGGMDFRKGSFPRGELTTVRVTYLFNCQVPLASFLICDAGYVLAGNLDAALDVGLWWEARQLNVNAPRSLTELPAWLDRAQQLQRSRERRNERIDRFAAAKPDLDQVELPWVQSVLLLGTGSRYLRLQAEASLPLQSARYYPRED